MPYYTTIFEHFKHLFPSVEPPEISTHGELLDEIARVAAELGRDGLQPDLIRYQKVLVGTVKAGQA